MEKASYSKTSWYRTILNFPFILTLLSCVFCGSSVNAGVYDLERGRDTVAEKKVDYLEQIYFSGENKEGLNRNILIAIQAMESKEATLAVAKQYTFLSGIKDRASSADNACDILEIIAVGIYNIDAAEASQQGVKMPSDKAKAKNGDVVSNLGKLGSSSGNLNSSASNVAWSSYYLNGGRTTGLASGASSVARTAGTVSSVAGAAGSTVQTLKQGSDLIKGFGIGKKDKPCKEVSQKSIELGAHIVPAAKNVGSNMANNIDPSAPTLTTVINIPGINTSLLRSFNDTLKTKPGVRSSEKTYNEALSTITVVHTGSTSDLADWVEDKFGAKYAVVDYGAGKINLKTKH